MVLTRIMMFSWENSCAIIRDKWALEDFDACRGLSQRVKAGMLESDEVGKLTLYENWPFCERRVRPEREEMLMTLPECLEGLFLAA
jgi:hypothetical protein